MKNSSKIKIALSLFILLCPAPAKSDTLATSARELLQSWLEPTVIDQAPKSLEDPRDNPFFALARFYQLRDYQLSWVDDNGLLAHTQLLFQALQQASGDGLVVMENSLEDLSSELASAISFSDTQRFADLRHLVQMDVSLTGLMLKFAVHMSEGQVRPEAISEEWLNLEKPQMRDLPGELAEAVNQNRLDEFLKTLGPQQRQYQELKSVLKRYRQIETDGGWPSIPMGPKLTPEDRDDRVQLLRHHLMITGDLPLESASTDNYFDASLKTAVIKFQHRHGLFEDGIVGKKTLAALNVPVEERITELILNMERWRWQPRNYGPRYLMVNIPAFELKVYENDSVTLSMRTIVGKKDRPTPVLAGQMTYLVLNPFWNIPQKIAREDILPKIKKDPEFLNKQGIQVFDSWKENAPELNPLNVNWQGVSEDYFPYRLRQVPTISNALGRIKFMFPNPFSIYIHDTPGKYLFNRPQRLFSSGCVRVEEPLALAAELLKNQRWNQRRLYSTIRDGNRQTIVLKAPLPVYIVYFTAWTEKDGSIHFREDVYNRDRKLYQALLKGSSKIYMCKLRPDLTRDSQENGLPRL